MRGLSVAMIAATLALTACDRSDNSRIAGAVFDNSQRGVVTSPQLGHLNEQPDVGGQLNVTTATKATSPTSTLGGGANQTATAADQTSGT